MKIFLKEAQIKPSFSCTQGKSCFFAFLVELGAARIVASTIVPVEMRSPFEARS